jgi:hypothetical protein
MKTNLIFILLIVIAFNISSNPAEEISGPSNAMPMLPPGMRPRVIATTDGEVDDRSSMIRFLLYTCDFDVAGIVQVNSRYQKSGHSDKKWIEAQLDTYEKLLPQLRKHNPSYSTCGSPMKMARFLWPFMCMVVAGLAAIRPVMPPC